MTASAITAAGVSRDEIKPQRRMAGRKPAKTKQRSLKRL